MNPTLPVLVLLIASVFWGLTWWPLKQFHALGLAGVPLTFAAFGAVSLVMLPLLLAQRRRWAGGGRALLAIAVLGGYANLAFTSAMIYGEVVRVMALFYLLPVWGVLGGRLFLGERIDTARGLAVGLALGGAVLILGGSELLMGVIAWPDLLAVTCGIAFAGNNLLFRARQSLPLQAKVAAMLCGCFAFAAVLTVLRVQPWPEVPPGSWAWVVLYGVGWILLATIATQWAITHLEAGRASILIIVELVTALVTAVLFGGEQMSGIEMLGAALIMLAAVIEARRGSVPLTQPHCT